MRLNQKELRERVSNIQRNVEVNYQILGKEVIPFLNSLEIKPNYINCFLDFPRLRITTTFNDMAPEDLVEEFLGPIHRRYDFFWTFYVNDGAFRYISPTIQLKKFFDWDMCFDIDLVPSKCEIKTIKTPTVIEKITYVVNCEEL